MVNRLCRMRSYRWMFLGLGRWRLPLRLHWWPTMAIQRAVSSFLNSISSITIPDKANLHQATSPHSTQTLPSKARNWKSTENTNSASTYQNTGPKTRSPCGPTKSRDKKSSVAFSLRATATFRTMLTRLFLPMLQRSWGFIRMVVSSLSFVIVGRMLSRGVPLGCLRFLDPPNKYLWNLWKSELRWKALRGKDLVLRFDFFWIWLLLSCMCFVFGSGSKLNDVFSLFSLITQITSPFLWTPLLIRSKKI